MQKSPINSFPSTCSYFVRRCKFVSILTDNLTMIHCYTLVFIIIPKLTTFQMRSNAITWKETNEKKKIRNKEWEMNMIRCRKACSKSARNFSQQTFWIDILMMRTRKTYAFKPCAKYQYTRWWFLFSFSTIFWMEINWPNDFCLKCEYRVGRFFLCYDHLHMEKNTEIHTEIAHTGCNPMIVSMRDK